MYNFNTSILLIIVLDIISILGSYFFALLLRFDFTFSDIGSHYVKGFLDIMPLWCVLTVAVFYICRLYHSIWRQASIAELEMIVMTYALLVPCYWAAAHFLGISMPRSFFVMGYILNFCLSTGIRFSYRMLRLIRQSLTRRPQGMSDRVMVIGAGSAGQMLVKELRNSDKLSTRVCCVIDDNPTKKGRVMEGVEIVGNRHDIVNMARKYDITRIIYAIPSNSPEETSRILNICKETNCKLQRIPGMYQLINDEVNISQLRDVEAVGTARCAIHEPVAAFDQQSQTHGKQQDGYQHNIHPF